MIRVHGYAVQGYIVIKLQDIQLRVTSHTVYNINAERIDIVTQLYNSMVQSYNY